MSLKHTCSQTSKSFSHRCSNSRSSSGRSMSRSLALLLAASIALIAATAQPAAAWPRRVRTEADPAAAAVIAAADDLNVAISDEDTARLMRLEALQREEKQILEEILEHDAVEEQEEEAVPSDDNEEEMEGETANTLEQEEEEVTPSRRRYVNWLPFIIFTQVSGCYLPRLHG